MNGQVKDLIIEAVAKIKAGRVEDGLLVLERVLHPKRDDHYSTHSAYQRAMESKRVGL